MKREIFVGDVGIGGNHPVSIQSMTSTPTTDIQASLNQIQALKNTGCQIVRMAIPDQSSLNSFRKIIQKSPLPIIADIHFDSNLALKSSGNVSKGK